MCLDREYDYYLLLRMICDVSVKRRKEGGMSFGTFLFLFKIL